MARTSKANDPLRGRAGLLGGRHAVPRSSVARTLGGGRYRHLPMVAARRVGDTLAIEVELCA